MKTENDPMLSGYLSYLNDVKRLAKRSVVDMRCTFKKAINYFEKIKSEAPLYTFSFEDFLLWIENERRKGKSDATVNKQISHVRNYLDYALRLGRVTRNVLDGFNLKGTASNKAPRVLTINEATQLIDNCSTKNKQDRRKRTIILLLYGCGLRTHELCSLNIQDINIEKQQLFIRKGKRDIQRYIPVPPGVWTELLAYLNDRKGKKGPLFRTEIKGKRIRDKNVLNIVRNAVKSAGIEEKITPKTLRHTFASHLMDAGVNLAVISTLMGHRSPRETGVYLHAFKDRKIAAVNKLNSTSEEEEL